VGDGCKLARTTTLADYADAVPCDTPTPANRPISLGKRQQEEAMIIPLYIAAAIIMAVGSLYFAWRSRDFRKFLAGAFFVSSGILFYLYLADVSVPLLGTGFVETPQISGARSIVHFILFLLCSYYGFRKQSYSRIPSNNLPK
jgi:uncharacterized protein (DUF486 family)